MIRTQDIRDRAAEWQLRPDIVEKDYVLGWVLAGLALHPVARRTWVFKGGTCLKKCYVETYRFSEDLDFSLLADAPYTEEDLRGILEEATRRAGELSGIEFPSDRIEVRSRQDKLGRPTFEARISYRGPLGIPSYPRVLFDITQHEPVFDQPATRQIYHPYPDGLPDGLEVSTYSLNELLAEKVRALYERTRPRDLYDVVYLLENKPDAFDLARVRGLLGEKCAAKGMVAPSAQQLLGIITEAEELRSEWFNMLSYQLPITPDLDDLLGRLPGLTAWIDVPTAVLPEERLARVPTPAEEPVVAPAGIRYWGGGSPLEALRFAVANRLLVEFTYNGRRRRVEPYSLRRAGTGNLLLYGWEEGTTHIKAFNTARLVDVGLTGVSFTPRYRVELTAGGPLSAPPAVTSAARPGRRRRGSARPISRSRPHLGPTYLFECLYCQKRFRRLRNDSALGKHKMKGSQFTCPGRRGYLVSIQ